ENTECLYVRQERLEDDGNTAVAQRVITRRASERIARKAFETARTRGFLTQRRGGAEKEGERGRGGEEVSGRNPQSPISQSPLVTIVHKANVLSLTDGLFREACLTVAREYPDVQVEEQIVDSMIYRMIREPER